VVEVREHLGSELVGVVTDDAGDQGDVAVALLQGAANGERGHLGRYPDDDGRGGHHAA
jgi:hypothetical protein